MKKAILVALSISLLSILLISFISAQVTTPEELFAQQTGIEQIPKSPEELKQEIKERYLKQEWSNIIAKIPIIGKIHTFFLAHPLPFKILFNYQYEISLTFILIVILWLFTITVTSDLIRASGLVKGVITLLIGLGTAIIFAQINLLKVISTKSLDLIYTKEAWWIRLILWLVFIAILAVLYYAEKILGKTLKKNKEAKEKAEVKQKVEEHEEFVKGAEEAEKITKGFEQIGSGGKRFRKKYQ